MEKDLSSKQAVEKLKKLAEDVRTCMMASADISDELYGRPMYTMKVDDDASIWFFTKDNKQVAQGAAGSDRVALYYSDPGKNTYLTVRGTQQLVKDKAKMKELWTPMLKAWFPEGLDEPGITLLKVIPEQAHYWDVDAAKLVIFFSMVRAAVTGEVTDMGSHGSLNIK